MRTRFMLVTFVALVWMGVPALAVAAPSAPFDTSQECQECHAADTPAWPQADFSAGTVNRDTGCLKCHGTGSAGIKYIQSLGENPAAFPHHVYPYKCGESCHIGGGWGYPWNAMWPRQSTARGWFNSTYSYLATTTDLHWVHKRPRWAANLNVGPDFATPVDCAGCHAQASCDACHETLDSSHAMHSRDASTGAWGVTPWVGDVSHGSTNYKQSPDRTAEQVGCSASACHDPDADPTPLMVEENSPAITYSGTWVTDGPRNFWYENLNARYTITADSSLEVTFTGTQVGLVGGTGTGNGIAAIYIDGSFVGNADQYGQGGPRVWWKTSGLAPGEHSLRVVHTGLKNPASYAYKVLIDAIEVSSPSGQPFVRTCLDCHAEKSADHGFSEAVHTATLGTREAGDGHLCAECHSESLAAEHGKATSSSAAKGCTACHGDGGPADQLIGTWDGTCDTPACHGAASDQPIHANYCIGCHEKGNPDFAVHETSFAATVDRNGCRSCHGTGITDIGRYKVGRKWFGVRHLSHNATEECKGCHYWDPRRTEFYTHSVTTSFGAFATAGSTDPTPARAHSVHASGSWPQSIEFAPTIYCANCHQPAACASCHPVASLPVEHASHGNTASSTVSVAPGALSYTAPKTAATETRSCTAAACHGADASQVPTCASCHPERAATHW